MNVIYLINSDFALRGTGNIAYNAVRGIYSKGFLKRAIVREFRQSEVGNDYLVKPVPFGRLFPRMLTGIHLYVLHSFSAQYYSDRMFDLFSLWHIEKCDIFHSWNSPLRCIEKARNLGAVITGDGASSYPLTQNRLVCEEFGKYGINYRPSRLDMNLRIRSLEASDYVFVPSDFVYDSYVENGYPKEKLVKIPFGVDLERFRPVKEKEDDVFRAVFVGQIELRKGVQYLLEAWNKLKLKNSELILRGRIHPDAKRIVEHYRGRINLKTPGYGDPRQDYSRSDVFVFPSIEEGSALVSYEAMASGLPVIVSYNTGSVARDGVDGYVVPIRDVGVLAEKIQYFYDNPSEVARMGANARMQAEKYSWDRYGENIVKAYGDILK